MTKTWLYLFETIIFQIYKSILQIYVSLFISRLKLTFSCMMDLSKFPLDSQVCTMEVASCEFFFL